MPRCYTPLCAAAELHAALAVEHALRLRHKASPTFKEHQSEPGLKQLLRIAIAQGWIVDDGFDVDYRELVVTEQGVEYHELPTERRRRPTEIVLDVLPDIRNDLAHGQARMTLEHGSAALQRARGDHQLVVPILAITGTPVRFSRSSRLQDAASTVRRLKLHGLQVQSSKSSPIASS